MSSSTGDDGSRRRCSTDGNDDDDDEEEEEASGFTRVVWLRQMLHRWQSSASTATAKSSSASASGERANNDDPAGASTADWADNDAAGSGGGSERDPLLPASSEDRPWAVEESCRYPDEEGGDGGSDSPMTPMTPDAPAGVPRGCCPVYVGLVAPERRRFVVPTSYLGMPVFRRLLEKVEEEFEFHYGGGGVTIPCDTEAFKYILLVMERHRQGLVDDEGDAKEEDDRGGQQRGGYGSSSSEAQVEATMAASSGAEGDVIGGKAITLHGT